ncbi:MAG: DMT family transporter [Pseudomonadota bacterium]
MRTEGNNVVRGALLVIGASLILATMTLGVQFASADAPSSVVTFGIFATGWIILVPFLLLRRGLRFFATKHPSLMVVRAVVGTLQIATLFFAVSTISLVEANLMRELAPIWVPVLLWLFWREAMPSKLWFGIILGFAGMALVLHPAITHLAVGYVFALANGILYGLQSILSRRLGELHEPVLRISCYIYTAAIIVLGVPAALHWQPLSLETWGFMAVIGAMMVVSANLLLLAFQQAPAYVLAPFGYSAVVFSAVLDWAVYGLVPSLAVIVGAVMVVFAGYLIIRLSNRYDESRVH